MVRRKPVGLEVVDEPEGRFVVHTYAEGEVVRVPVVRKEPAWRPRCPPTKVFAARMDRTRKKQY